MEQTKNPKCNSCKSYWKPDETDILPSGLYAKSCKKCREYQKEKRERLKCVHNKRKSYCKECGGGSICEHNRHKSKCKDCGGGSICEHNRQKSQCRECGGVSICEHNITKSTCKECGGSDICPHNKRKSTCKECGGSQICEHNRIKSTCKECGGSQICPHNRHKSKCKDCGGGSICEHNRQKSHCKECNFKLYLVHLHRTALKRCIKLSNLDKIKPSIDYLGCSVEYFMEYLKKKIDNFNQYSEIEMTWDNIHIDHIKPVSSFNLDDEEEFLSCCNYTNLQPLIAEINLNKSCKWSDKDNTYWTDNIKDKEHYDIYIPK